MKGKQSLRLQQSALNSEILSVIIYVMHMYTSHQLSEVLSMPVFSVGPDPVDMLQIG